MQLQLREHGQPGLCHTRHISKASILARSSLFSASNFFDFLSSSPLDVEEPVDHSPVLAGIACLYFPDLTGCCRCSSASNAISSTHSLLNTICMSTPFFQQSRSHSPRHFLHVLLPGIHEPLLCVWKPSLSTLTGILSRARAARTTVTLGRKTVARIATATQTTNQTPDSVSTNAESSSENGPFREICMRRCCRAPSGSGATPSIGLAPMNLWMKTSTLAEIHEESSSCFLIRRLSDPSSVMVVLLSLRWGCREHFVSGCWHSSGRDRGRYPRECWLSTLGVLHPGVPVMWYGHIRDLFPTAEGCKGSRPPIVTMLHWAQQK